MTTPGTRGPPRPASPLGGGSPWAWGSGCAGGWVAVFQGWGVRGCGKGEVAEEDWRLEAETPRSWSHRAAARGIEGNTAKRSAGDMCHAIAWSLPGAVALHMCGSARVSRSPAAAVQRGAMVSRIKAYLTLRCRISRPPHHQGPSQGLARGALPMLHHPASQDSTEGHPRRGADTGGQIWFAPLPRMTLVLFPRQTRRMTGLAAHRSRWYYRFPGRGDGAADRPPRYQTKLN